MKKTNTICTVAAVCSALLLITATTMLTGCLEAEPQTQDETAAAAVQNDTLPEANTYAEPQFSDSPETAAERNAAVDAMADTANTAATYGLAGETSENMTEEPIPADLGTESESVHTENGTLIN
ncbi:hypothetical protein [Treponema brennaborense]|uniref:Lipoprotein n=1 Tax=Treponema brennaborense (strain DSM 12168 / CIP 105900 / DD5/3) TaxID=906968 RepID=F4LIR6_TREBD|nr:hypothetical protein [Treponema brennaborense]AEE16241.1 hypothetical protein Trebr_0805 [Treponema brennaborense DSM 12168]